MKTWIILGLLLLPFIASTQEGNFKWQNPLPHGNDYNGCCCISGHFAWAVGDAGTIVKSPDQGISWILQNSGVSKRLGGVSFVDSLTGWVCGDQQTLLHTENGGETWEQQDIPYVNRLNDIQFINENEGWAVGSERHILHTSDGGLNWVVQYSGTSFDLKSISFPDELHGYAVGWEGSFMRTIDGGESWLESQYFDEDHWLYSVFFIDPDTGYICGSYSHGLEYEHIVFKTVNGGLAWSPYILENAFPYDIYFTDPQNGTIAASGGVYQTSDAGESWSYIDFNIPREIRSVSFTGENFGICAGVEAAVLSRSGGPDQSWVFNGPLTTEYMRDIEFTDALNGWAVGSYNTVLHTTNGGETWDTIPLGPPGQLAIWFSVEFSGPMNGWISGFSGDIYHTSDGGLTWALQNSSTYQDIYALFFLDENYGWAVGEGDIRLRTTNGGETWFGFPSLMWEFTNDVFFIDQNTGWVVGEDGFINKTVNGGANWAMQYSNTNVFLNSVFFITAMNGWIVGSNSTILHTTDGGLNWIPQTIPENTYLQDIFFITSEDGWITGDSGLIMHTVDGGTNWTRELVITDNSLNAVIFTDQDTGWICGSGGAILAYKPDSTVNIEDHKNSQLVNRNQTLHIFPNPCTSQVTIRIDEDKLNEISIYDLSGKLIKQIKLEPEVATHDEILLDFRGFSPGVYLIEALNDNIIKQGKIILY